MNRRALLAAGAAVGIAWLAAPHGAPPLYDGIGFPDEPYRYVQPPAGYQHTKPPTAAKESVAFQNGLSANTYITSAEQGPQISIFIGQGAVQAPTSLKKVMVVGQPLAPSPPLPTDGVIVTNVYRVQPVTSAAVTFRPKSAHYTPSYISMRAPTAKQPGPIFEVRDADGKWTDVDTQRTGQDIYSAMLSQFGDYALVQLTHPTATPAAASSSSSNGVNGALIGVGIAVVILGTLIGLIRLRRLRRS